MDKILEKTLLLGPQDVERTLQRIAHELWEAHTKNGDVALVGILTRGYHLAVRLGEIIGALRGHPVEVGALDIGLYRDDLEMKDAAPLVRSTEIPFDLDGRPIVLVDDVLFTGRTVRAALNAICDLGRPDRVRLTVLVDRGHRELPVAPDFVGREVYTRRNDAVKVLLREIDGEDAVYLVETR